MNKRLTTIGVILLSSLFFISGHSKAQSYHKLLFERGIFVMETQSDPQKAIPIFSEIIERYSNDRMYAALAQYYLGVCYKRLDSDQSIQAFQQVVNGFPAQTQIVSAAKAELMTIPAALNRLKQKDSESKPILLWKGKCIYGSAAVSENGRYYCYIDLVNGKLMLYDLIKRNKRELAPLKHNSSASEYAESVVISPDSSRIAFSWRNNRGQSELRIIDQNGSGNHILLRGDDIKNIAASDWAEQMDLIVACVTRSDDTHQIILISARNGSILPVNTPEQRYPYHLRISPNGSMLAYGRRKSLDNPEKDIFLLDIQEQTEKELVVQPGVERLIDWTHDGHKIIYTTNNSGSYEVWSLGIWRGEPRPMPRLIRAGLEAFEPLGFTNTGTLYFAIKGTEVEIWKKADFLPARLSTLTVPYDFPSIQAAVSAAKNGDTIYVRNGRYNENILIEKPLTLQGEERNSTIIDGGGTGSVINILSGNVDIQGLTVTHGETGIDIRPSRPVKNITIKDVLVTLNSGAGILSRHSGGEHIIEASVFSYNIGYGINAHQFSQSIIRDNHIFGNGAGLRVGWGSLIQVRRNIVYHNKTNGIYPDSCYYSTFENNLIFSNSTLGIKMGYISSRNIIRGNIVLENKEGIRLGLERDPFSKNIFYHNDIINNESSAQESRPGLAAFQIWDEGSISGGNFWSDYTGPDKNKDNIGDKPFELIQGARDNFPQMQPRNTIPARLFMLSTSPDQNGLITIYLELPARLPLQSIKRDTLRLNKAIFFEDTKPSIGDADQNGIPDMKLKFSVYKWENLSISGYLDNGLQFKALNRH